jgi:pyruvate/2-oxoglutarate dehydrogenase complex dihydrolipoamide acyltransferase (E2) component
MPNVELTPLELSSWRKIALGTWGHGGDPSVYGTLELDATRLLARQKQYAERTGKKAPTVTAVVAAATAAILRDYPQLNGMVRWGRIYLRKSVTLFLQAAADDAGRELSGLTIRDAEAKSLEQIVDEIAAKAQAIREDRDPAFKKIKGQFRVVPTFLVRFVLNVISFLTYTLNLDLSSLGAPRDAFGSVMITSIGSIGLDQAFAPLVPYSRVPLLLAVGAVRPQPVVVDGQLAVAPQFKICATFDHRFIDGVYAARMARALRRLLETDEGLESLGLR